MRLYDSVLPRFALLILLMGDLSANGDESPVDFQRHVHPIFAEHCARCHGVDAESREAGLRLDVREAALQGGDSGTAAVVPGDADQSELIARVTSDDPDYLMPPPSEGKPLSAPQKQILKRWIQQGAPYARHWAFVSPRKVPLPDVGPTHPIDLLVADRLKTKDLTISVPAEAEILCRRIYLDLIGLPPSPAELDAFAKTDWEQTIDHLLASERFGEKWAQHWLDAARYSDTNGYEKDLRRDQWAWRDWVIDALNRDMPYDQFIVEQIAGDLLPNARQSQMIATGFLRNSMLNEEGAIVPEQFRMVEMFDRLDCIGKSILGLTTQCAQCHTHKFDPLTQDEYYGMFAYLNNAYEAQSHVYTDDQQRTLDEIAASIEDLEEQIRTIHPNWKSEIEMWQKQQLERHPEWTPVKATELGSVSGSTHPTQLADNSLLMLGSTSIDMFMIAQPTWHRFTGLRFELLDHGDLPFRGPGRNTQGSWVIREIEVFVQEPGGDEWEKLKLTHASTDFPQPEQTTDEGQTKSRPVSFLIDGTDDTVWRADRGRGRRNQASVAVMQFETPLERPPGTRLKIALRMHHTDMVGCCRFSLTQDSNPVAAPINHAAILAMQTPVESRSAIEERAIFTAWRMTLDDCAKLNKDISQQWDRTPDAMTTVLHLAEREPVNHRDTFLLDRGEWDRPQHRVMPTTPAAFHPMPDDAPRNRLGFARWLASEDSPLTARVAVNRVWQTIFGAGLVETPEDFGTRAPVPEYHELLDWLAVDLMEHNWSQKHLIKRIVTSDVYQQRSAVSADLLRRDPSNRWLARGPRFRAEAELVRDIALTASGLITHKVGGPPVIPPVPQNVLNGNFFYPSYWKAADGPDRYRRTLYGFRKRSMPDPVMSSFDGPNGDSACVRRVRSNTPLAALTGLNETVFVEAARALALRLLREGGDSDGQRARYAFRLCTSRWPTDAERDELLKLLDSRRARLADGWLNAREIATGDGSQLPDLPGDSTPQDAAAWMLVARVLLNLDETISKN